VLDISIARENALARREREMVSKKAILLVVCTLMMMGLSTIAANRTMAAEPTWAVLLNITGSGGTHDTLTFGEALDASDGKDSYDIVKPAMPMPPAVYTWFSTGLEVPYNSLWNEFREYPGTAKVWEAYVYWSASSSATITIQWDPSQLSGAEYTSILLKDVDAGTYVDMRLNSEYSYVSQMYGVRHFQIVGAMEYDYHVPLAAGWNFVSMPVNETISPSDITVNYNNINYTWQEAVDNTIVLGTIYGWSAAEQNYIIAEDISAGCGYWLYAYEPCVLWVTTTTPPNTDSYIAELKAEWNLVGLPYTAAVDKANLLVKYDGTTYTWQQAIDNGIVLKFIYGWDMTYYTLEDVLGVGQARWMYAYHDCILGWSN
jgi:hypothetical protein